MNRLSSFKHSSICRVRLCVRSAGLFELDFAAEKKSIRFGFDFDGRECIESDSEQNRRDSDRNSVLSDLHEFPLERMKFSLRGFSIYTLAREEGGGKNGVLKG